MAVDPRAFAAEKLTPPEPLPYISRKALKRVKDPAPIPTQCEHCAGKVELVSHTEIYSREYGDWPYAYLCTGCGAYVGLHPNTDIPLGTLATPEMREARKRGKGVFLALSKRFSDRNTQYKWLAERMGIPASECHWGLFTVEQAKQAERICYQELLQLQRR